MTDERATPEKDLIERLRGWPTGGRANTAASECHEAADRIESLERQLSAARDELSIKRGLLKSANACLQHQASVLSEKDRDLQAWKDRADRVIKERDNLGREVKRLELAMPDYAECCALRDRAQAELEAARKDAERYRWLRAKARTDTGDPWIARSSLSGISAWTVEHADAAIDDAAKREEIEHVCGLQGFNPMKGDRCSACELRSAAIAAKREGGSNVK